MKKTTAIILLFTLLLCSCNTKTSYISFKDYVNTVTNAQEKDKNIFVFTASSCSYCNQIRPFLEKYKQETADVNIYELSIDASINLFTNKTQFTDKTMGYVSNDSSENGLKALDNRIALFDKANKTNISDDKSELIYFPSQSQYYNYVVTPLLLFYQGNIEVKIVNNVVQQLEKDKSDNYTYDSFKKLMEYPQDKNEFDKPFDLVTYK